MQKAFVLIYQLSAAFMRFAVSEARSSSRQQNQTYNVQFFVSEIQSVLAWHVSEQIQSPEENKINWRFHTAWQSNLHYTRGIMPKRVTSGGIHLHCPWLNAWATQLRRNIAAVGSRWDSVRFDRPGSRIPDLPHRCLSHYTLILHFFLFALN